MKNDPYNNILLQMLDDVKKYLGYPPHNNSKNSDKRSAEFLKSIENKYGRTLPDLLRKTGLDDYGEVPDPKDVVIPRLSIIKAAKLAYGVEGFYFYTQYNAWFCTVDSKAASQESAMTNDQVLIFKTVLKFLSGEINYKNSTFSAYRVYFVDNNTIYDSLDSLREELLIRKLSGLL